MQQPRWRYTKNSTGDKVISSRVLCWNVASCYVYWRYTGQNTLRIHSVYVQGVVHASSSRRIRRTHPSSSGCCVPSNFHRKQQKKEDRKSWQNPKQYKRFYDSASWENRWGILVEDSKVRFSFTVDSLWEQV